MYARTTQAAAYNLLVNDVKIVQTTLGVIEVETGTVVEVLAKATCDLTQSNFTYDSLPLCSCHDEYREEFGAHVRH